jgi:hypothetical protein
MTLDRSRTRVYGDLMADPQYELQVLTDFPAAQH